MSYQPAYIIVNKTGIYIFPERQLSKEERLRDVQEDLEKLLRHAQVNILTAISIFEEIIFLEAFRMHFCAFACHASMLFPSLFAGLAG